MAQMDLAALPSRALLAEGSPVRHVDLWLALSAALLPVYGLFMVYSATHRSLAEFNQDPGFYLKKQLVFLMLGLVAMVLVAALDYRLLRHFVPILYLGTLLLLLLVQTPLGSSVKGAQRSFEFAGFQLSPSYFMRITLILMLAAVLSQVKGEVGLRHIVRAVALGVIPMMLVFVQPDLGTTIILAFILVAMLVVSGAKARYLFLVALVAMLAMFGAFQTHLIKDYQLQRISGFFDPKSDPQRAGYNKQQAEIAVGSGGIVGRGYLKGTQTNLDFVPEQHTDFIFTVVGEELGFVGAFVLLLLFGVVLWRAYRIALLSRDPFGTFVAAGVAAMISIQVFINVGMTIGIMPITGIPLPFISYGGSALIADLIGIGLLQSVHVRRRTM
jgi:rod shape determining protein RodA